MLYLPTIVMSMRHAKILKAVLSVFATLDSVEMEQFVVSVILVLVKIGLFFSNYLNGIIKI